MAKPQASIASAFQTPCLLTHNGTTLLPRTSATSDITSWQTTQESHCAAEKQWRRIKCWTLTVPLDHSSAPPTTTSIPCAEARALNTKDHTRAHAATTHQRLAHPSSRQLG